MSEETKKTEEIKKTEEKVEPTAPVLSESDLSSVAGGVPPCSTGEHLKKAIITV